MEERRVRVLDTAAGPSPRLNTVEILSYGLTGGALWLALALKLLGSLLAGLFVFQLIHLIAPHLEKWFPSQRARWVALILLSVIVTAALSLSMISAYSYLQRGAENAQPLPERLMQIIDGARVHLPLWLQEALPDGADELRAQLLDWLKAHYGELRQSGKEAVSALMRIVIGMVLGAMTAVNIVRRANPRPLAAALNRRLYRLSGAFKRIVFAQMKISLVNTALTSLYLLIALPLLGVRLPFSKTLVLMTFVVGLLPVIGNLISNTLIFVLSLSAAGLSVAIASLIFLIVIHKLEYFLNARIIGSEIAARAWELLLAMLVMEAGFGLPGVIAAPIYYAYLKRELAAVKLI
ncbi:putative membrane protein [Candidatus Glomeribacter gigasporarum BEG34]|uniref:Putative membrane protein n=1 Tax=Candidatus Glomeribacter gigasporarum BEG34 TaxID=1070319 RepID=G2JBS4_9BURK|nr:AI-2E family transporter [Candidatus Glomeribacter gigasporarum]CCD30229.1 putative membrane protein [Candidatus Glomeribacter gigasporarum BEG34]